MAEEEIAFQESTLKLSHESYVFNTVDGIHQARKKSTKINFLGPETARWGGGLPREGVVAEKFVPSLESLFSLGFEGRNVGCPGNFCRDVPDPWGCSKSSCKKRSCAFFVPYN